MARGSIPNYGRSLEVKTALQKLRLKIKSYFDERPEVETGDDNLIKMSDALKKGDKKEKDKSKISFSELGFTLVDDEFSKYSAVNDNIKFYFMFDRHSLVTAHLPLEVKNFIFKPATENQIVKVEYDKPSKSTEIMDLDQLLDKIKQMGVESLTIEEKNFLDNFEN